MLAGFGAMAGSRPTPGEAAIPGRLLGPGVGLLWPSEIAFLLPFVSRVNIPDPVGVACFDLPLIPREVSRL